VIDDPVALKAILDGLIHGAIKLELKGGIVSKKTGRLVEKCRGVVFQWKLSNDVVGAAPSGWYTL
jgi:hypothetical protein